MGFELDTINHTLRTSDCTISILVTNKGETFFHATEVAAFLGYAQPKVAVTKVLKGKNVKILKDLLPELRYPSSILNSGDKRQRYVNEPGLYRMIMQSNLPAAETFQDWVYEEVLPTLRRTGSYNINEPDKHVNATPWQQARVDGLEMSKLKNACLHNVISNLANKDADAAKLYAVTNAAVNRAVLDTDLTKAELFKSKGLPAYMSIPDFLDFDGHISRTYVETAILGHLRDNFDRLIKLPLQVIVDEIQALGKNCRRGNVATGYYVNLQDKMMSAAEARAAKNQLIKLRKKFKIQPSMPLNLLKG